MAVLVCLSKERDFKEGYSESTQMYINICGVLEEALKISHRQYYSVVANDKFL